MDGWTIWLPILSGVLSVLFVPLAVTRVWRLRKETVKTIPSWQVPAKLVISLVFAALQLATPMLLAILSAEPIPGVLIPAAASTVAALSLVWLSRIEHRRSVAPSDLIIIYVLFILLSDVIWLTAPSDSRRDRRIRLLAAVQLSAKALVFIAEIQSKEKILIDQYLPLPPEVKTNILGRSFFWWINPILDEGYKDILLNHELPNIDHYISSAPLRHKILMTWSDGRSTWLPLVLYRSLRGPFLSVIQPRLFVIVFRYSQPLLIQYSIRYVSDAYVGKRVNDKGFFVILAAIVIYTGLALSSVAYQHGINRLKIMVRGAVTGLIHAKSLTTQATAYNDGKALALASTDVSALEDSPDMVHETWALAIELIIGMFLLSRQVGRLWPLPLGIIFICSRISRYVASNMKSRSSRWNTATQQRITVTSTMVTSMKNIKMLGMQEVIASRILYLRQQEMEAANRFRFMMAIYNASANALGMFAPVLTIIVFAVIAMINSQPLDTETAFPTIAILAMITHPANMIMTIVPRAFATYASFERVQSYLSTKDPEDQVIIAESVDNTTPAISLRNVSVPGEKGDRKTLEDVSIVIPKGSAAIVSGPVGAGKTILARVLLGEVTPSEGTVALCTKRIAYCSQVPWLPGRCIKDVICGPSDEDSRDQTWYETVLKACCLIEDLDALPDGDHTFVGANGMNLSGGQRQRVALARAVYQRCRVNILDDTFSGLDGRTEDQVIKNLFGPKGLLRELGTTVLWITNSTKHFHLADNIVILDGKVKEQGAWENLQAHTEQISKLIRHDAEDGMPVKKDLVLHKRAQALSDALKDLKRKTGDISLYSYYFKSAGYLNIFSMIFCAASCSFFVTFPQLWVKWWTEDTRNHTLFYTVGYFLLTLAAWISTNGIRWSYALKIAPRSGIALHQRLVETVTGASLYFFSTTDPGSILNRFGQDMQLVDKQLAAALETVVVQIFKIIAQALLVFAVQPWIALTLPICALVLFVVQKIYLSTSRQLRVIELESRSGIFSSLLETSQGLETIRAFGWQQEIAQENTRVLDASQRPFYLLFCLQGWLNIVLNLLVAGIAIGIISLAVVLRGTTTGGQIGVALVVILTTSTTLVKLVGAWTDLEVSLGAVARLKLAETKVPREDQPGEDSVLDTNWPSAGDVEFKDVTAAYNKNAVAYTGLNIRIKSGQTAVICGRTGSGKSSVLLSLLRLVDIKAGSILVDGVDISQVSRAAIRQRCFITVAQDPFILPQAPLRFNLDPSEAVRDEALMSVLEDINLRRHFSIGASGPEGGEVSSFLDKPMSDLPTLSGGQAQLLAIARAIIQAEVLASPETSAYSDSVVKPIILLDEITSSLDALTETTVYEIIRKLFTDKGHTVIMVTHKLGSFARYMRPGEDVVVWLKDGHLERIDDAASIAASEA